MHTKTIKLLIVDDSPVSRQLLSYIAETDPFIHLLGYAENGLEAVTFVENTPPDVILMDINMPKMNGFDATRHIMREHPIPIIICSSEYHSLDVHLSFQAIEAGALAILEKPRGLQGTNFEAIVKEYIDTIRTVAEVKLITRQSSSLPSCPPPVHTHDGHEQLKKIDVLGIGSSLGGPQTLKEILLKLHTPFRVPIIIVQHITPGFTEGFASWLNQEVEINVKIATHQEMAIANTVYIAPSNCQICLDKKKQILLTKDESINSLCPSISHFFHSLAINYGEKAAGMILTGMGRDGVNELLLMKQKGALTIAQGSQGCIMFGMPREAIHIGSATHILNLESIPAFLNQIN